ncbi:hypothetical protein PT974_06343 [Cladobotryum mycophilum]|uniref:Nascent polypeptide-associated complex subunit alpha-like UBA domain-containing protein n=1 Tax=Cladobotryum mycophilum TaxID=491253 RepID=A0ABR0SLB0_9HYPO
MASKADIDDETPTTTATSAEDRKAASALANLDASNDDAASGEVDQEAVSKAMKGLGSSSTTSSAAKPSGAGAASAAAASKKNVKIDPADVALLVDQLDLARNKATELLKQHDGDAVAALRLFARA